HHPDHAAHHDVGEVLLGEELLVVGEAVPAADDADPADLQEGGPDHLDDRPEHDDRDQHHCGPDPGERLQGAQPAHVFPPWRYGRRPWRTPAVRAPVAQPASAIFWSSPRTAAGSSLTAPPMVCLIAGFTSAHFGSWKG